jgi:hypothetical protein
MGFLLGGFKFNLCLKQGFYFCFYRLYRIFTFTVCLGISKHKKIAKIAPALFNYSFSLGFPTLIIGPGCMKDTIETAVQVRSAKGTDLLPAHRGLYSQTF